MGLKYLKPDYGSDQFKGWQTRNPGAPSEWYQPSVNVPDPDPNYKFGSGWAQGINPMGTNPNRIGGPTIAEEDAQQSFLRREDNPTAAQVTAAGYKVPGYTVPAAGYTPNYDNAPGLMVTQGAVDKGFELMPDTKYDIVNKLPDYAGGVQSYGRRVDDTTVPAAASSVNPAQNETNWTQRYNTTSVTPEMITGGFKFMPGNSYIISKSS